MKRIAWTSCLVVLIQALTGCCSCCDMNRGSGCYSNCLPADDVYSTGGGCCGDDLEYGLPPSPYGSSRQRGMRPRGRTRGLPPVYYGEYSTDPYVQDMGTTVDDGSMYESFPGEVLPGQSMPQTLPGDSGWQPKPASPMPPPAAVPESGPSALSAPSPIPAISTAPVSVPGPPTSGIPRTSNSISGPDMGPMPPPIPEPVSQMGYRRQLPVQRAF